MNNLRAPVLILVFAILALALPAPLAAQSLLERLVMPGPLTQSHAKLETECANCHLSFSQGAQVSLCLDCHKPIAADIENSMGYHGRSPEAQAQNCSHCHTDHEGRDFQIVDLDRETFDHGETDFALTGAHVRTTCADCHAPDAAFREAPATCIGCHKDDEPHRGALGEDCASCHISSTWTEIAAFDHAATGFALVGTHETVSCVTCHENEVYEGLPKDCVGCHRIQDVHANRFGPECQTCHTSTKWVEVRFDHDTDTDFLLTGQHRETNCNACHTRSVKEVTLPSDCVGCHRADDVHQGALGTSCENCHATQGWRDDMSFAHDFTRFPLIGLHTVVPCEGCHLNATFQEAQTDCASCHADEDVHKGSLGVDCATCHNPNGWQFWLFDHNRQTDFALTGGHAGLKCEGCHTPAVAPDDLSDTCISCHKDDDKHAGQFGADCGQCHTTQTFEGARLR